MAINRYNRPLSSPYISQYADYKLPYDAIQNAVLSRQQQFDRNQLMLANSASKYAQIASRPEDAMGKAQMIDNWLNNVNQVVNDKYGGDFSLAAGDIYNETAKFTNDPRWTSISEALRKQQAFQAKQQQAASTYGADLYKTTKFTGDQSIFKDGDINQLQDVNYDAIITNAPEYRRNLEQYFNNAKANMTTGNLDAINKSIREGIAAEESADALIGWYDQKKLKFGETYMDKVRQSYKQANLPEYQKYYDEGLRKYEGNTEAAQIYADNRADADILSAKNEYEFTQTSLRAQQNPAFGIGQNKPNLNVADLQKLRDEATPTLIMPGTRNQSPTTTQDLQKIIDHPEATEAEKEMAASMLEMTASALETSITPEAELYRSAKENYDVAIERDLDPITSNLAKGSNSLLFGGVQPGSEEESNNQILMESLIKTKLDPNNNNPEYSAWDIFTDNVSSLWEKTKGVALAASGNPALASRAPLKFIEGDQIRKEALEKEFANVAAHTTTDPIEAAEEVTEFIAANPDFASRFGVEDNDGNTIRFQGEVQSNISPQSVEGYYSPGGQYGRSAPPSEFIKTYAQETPMSLQNLDPTKEQPTLEEFSNQYHRTAQRYDQRKKKAEESIITVLGTYAKEELYFQTLNNDWRKKIQNVLKLNANRFITPEDISEQLGVNVSPDDKAYKNIVNKISSIELGEVDQLKIVRDKVYGGVEISIPAIDLLPDVSFDREKSHLTLRIDKTTLQDQFNELLFADESLIGMKKDFSNTLPEYLDADLTALDSGINTETGKEIKDFGLAFKVGGIKGTPTNKQLIEKINQHYNETANATMPLELENAIRKTVEYGMLNDPALISLGVLDPASGDMTLSPIARYYKTFGNK